MFVITEKLIISFKLSCVTFQTMQTHTDYTNFDRFFEDERSLITKPNVDSSSDKSVQETKANKENKPKGGIVKRDGFIKFSMWIFFSLTVFIVATVAIATIVCVLHSKSLHDDHSRVLSQLQRIESSLNVIATRQSVQKIESSLNSVINTLSQKANVKDQNRLSTEIEDLGSALNITLATLSKNINANFNVIFQHFYNLLDEVKSIGNDVDRQYAVKFCSSGNGCESHWRPSQYQCFKAEVVEKVTWYDAIRGCTTAGGFLAEIKDQDTWAYLERVVLPKDTNIHDMWLGASDEFREGTWRWLASGIELSFTKWHNKQPDNFKNSEHCLSVTNRWDHFYQWNDKACGKTLGYICQKNGESCDDWT